MAYRGVTARLPVGAQGFTGTANPSQAGPGHLIFAEGAELDGGIIRKDGGASLYNATNPVHGGLLDSFVKSQLHFDARVFDAQVSFPDTGGVVNFHKWTAAGTAQIDTGQSKFGGGSLQCNGTTDWITTPDSTDFTLGSGDFTAEIWFNCAAAGGTTQRICGQNDVGFTAGNSSFEIDRTSANVLHGVVWNGSTSFAVTGTTQFTNAVNTGWHHVAFVRVGNILRLFVDGVQEGGDVAFSGSVQDSNQVLAIGTGGANTTNPWNGWLDEFRLSVGIARWTQNFTPPTAAYADYTTEPARQIVADFATQSLLHFTGADAATSIADSAIVGTAARAWTAAGNAQIDTADFKFNTSSGLFDGTGDQFTTPDSADFTLGSGDFTIDLWFKPNGGNGSVLILAGQLDAAGSANANSAWHIFRNSTNSVSALVVNGTTPTQVDTTTIITTVTNPGWHHVAFVRSGNTLRLFIDGVQEGTASFSTSVNDSNGTVGVGGGGNFASTMFNGWIDEFRFVKGVAKWTVPFQLPSVEHIVVGTDNQMLQSGSLPTSVQSIAAGIHWNRVVGINTNIVYTGGGLILASTAGGWTGVVAFGLNAPSLDPLPHFVLAGGEAIGSTRKLFLFSGVNQVQKIDALTVLGVPIGTPPADWSGGNFPTVGVQHVFRLWGAGNANDPHRLYYSTSTDHTNFTGAGSGTLAVYPGEGERISGMVSFRGALIVFKYPRGIYVITTTDPTPANWRVDRLTKELGTVGPCCVVQIENDVAFLDRNGNVHLLSAVNEFGDVNTSNLSELSDMAPFVRQNMNLQSLQRANGTWYSAKRQLWFGMPLLGSQVANFRQQTSFPGLQQQQATGYPPRFFMSRRDEMESLWVHPDPANGILKPMIGDTQGFVYYMDQDNKNKNGVAYAIQFSTASTDLAFVDPSLANKYKNGEFIELAYEPRGQWDLTTDVFWDDIYTTTIFFNMGGAGATLGSFVLGTDILGSEGVRSQRKRMEGSGRRVRLAAQNSGLNQDVSLAEFYISFAVGDERAPGL